MGSREAVIKAPHCSGSGGGGGGGGSGADCGGDEQQQPPPPQQEGRQQVEQQQENSQQDQHQQPAQQQQPQGQQAGEFVNAGLLKWLERRAEWTHRPPDAKRGATPRKRSYAPAVTPEQVVSFAPFPRPVPLCEVIEALTEVWEQEEEDFF